MPVVSDKMRQYSHLRYAIYFIWVPVEFCILFLFLQSGLSAKTRTFAEERALLPVYQLLIYYAIFSAYVIIASFPLVFYSGFIIEHQYALTDQSFTDWLIEFAKKTAVSLVLVFPVKWCFFWLVRTQPKRWPVFLWLLTSVYLGIQSFIAPMVLEPIFNSFTPMKDGALKMSIERLADNVGMHGVPIFVADKSKQTKKLNAYVSGLGSSMHVVLWDTTLDKLPNDQVLSIVGHEMGHYVLKHELVDYLLAVAISSLSIPVNMYLAAPFVRRLPARWGIRDLGDYAVAPVLSMVLLVGGFLGEPIVNAWSRHIEHEADAFSLHNVGNRPAMARAFIALSEQNLSEPDPPPFIEFWMFSHPTLKDRIEYSLHGE